MPSDEDLGFTFRRYSNELIILHKGSKATTLRGRKATEFEADIQELEPFEQQQLMARLTGNYKHGNERVARAHPRNRR